MAKKQHHQNNDETEQFKSENSLCLQDDEQNDQNEIQYIEDIPDNMEIPFQEYRKSFSMFNNRNKPQNLKSYVKIKSQLQLERLTNAISFLSNGSKQQQLPQQIIQKFKNQSKNPHEFFSQSKVSPNTTIFIHIFSVNNKRCNIKVTNVFGYIFAYLTEIMPSRKFYKIYKILSKIGHKSLFIIFDEYEFNSKDSSFVKKISDYAQNFCYYSNLNGGKLPSKFTNLNLEQQSLISLQMQKKQKPTFIWIQNNIFWYFSKIFTQKQKEFQSLLNEMKIIQQKTQNPLVISQLNEIKDSSMNFILKNILINLSKLKKNQNTSQLFQSLRIMAQDHGNLAKDKGQEKFGNPLYHYPELLKASKECVHCQNNKDKIVYDKVKQNQTTLKKDFINKQTKKVIKSLHNSKKVNKALEIQDQICPNKKSKTKYRCEGCSAEAKKDIALCLDCFQAYHKKKQLAKIKSIKKAQYLSELRKERKEAKKSVKNQKDNSIIQQTIQIQNIKGSEHEQMNEVKNQKVFEYQEKELNVQEVQIGEMNLNLQVEQNSNYKQNSMFQENNNLQMDSIDDQDSQHSMNTRNKLQQLYQNQQYNKLLQKLEQQKQRFFQIFSKLIEDKKTRKIGVITAEYVKFKAMSLFDEQK